MAYSTRFSVVALALAALQHVHAADIFAAVDSNKDGFVTLDEIISHPSGMAEKHLVPMIKMNFPKADANGDGKLNREEWAAFTEMGAGEDIFAEVDSNKDGFVTLDEIISHPSGEAEQHHVPMIKKNFPKSDANGDGKLNREEWVAFTEMDDAGEDIFAEVDSNKDGFVTLDEIISHPSGEAEKHHLPMIKKNFPKADANGDGALNREEWAAFTDMDDWEGSALQQFAEVDADEDGFVTLDELTSHATAEAAKGEEEDQQYVEERFVPMVLAKFPKADADSDGKLNIEEWAVFTASLDDGQEL